MTKEEDKKKGGGGKPPEEKPEVEWTEEHERRFQQLLSVGEECITSEELKSLVSRQPAEGNPFGFRLYDGFEPSGRMHIAQGVFKAMNVNKCTSSGGQFIFWVADWFALMNDKMGGDLHKIKTTGQYLIEVWKAAGMTINDDNVIFKWASEEITQQAHVYWPQMLDIARRFNVTRIKKCCQIMGRLEGGLTSAQILYPLMQCNDVFFLKADICQLGVDQRKVNMLAREYVDHLKGKKSGKKRKPVVLSHHMLYGLKAGQEKMSKSDPDSAIFMEDTAEDVRRKIMAAYCPSKPDAATDTAAADAVTNEEGDAGKSSLHLVQDDLKNPCLDYVKHIIFSPPNATFDIPDGGGSYDTYEAVQEAFLSGVLSETQLKEGLINELNALLQPVRDHFADNDHARELLAQVSQFKKEAASQPTATEFRKLDIPGLSKGLVPPQCHLVFAPLPASQLRLQDMVNTLLQIQARAESSTKTVLFLSDWSARVQNACDADEKVIQSFYDIFVCCLKAFSPAVMDKVIVLKQSEEILKDPSNYWISVINVGRHMLLDDVMGGQMKDSDGVGRVIARLMRVADALAVSPSSIAFPPTSTTCSASVTEATANDDIRVEQSLVKDYLSLPAVLSALGSDSPPIVAQVPESSSLLLQVRESDAHKTENDEYFLLDDPKMHGKSKMKKAFCEPGNVKFCPPIAVVSSFCFSGLGNDTTNGGGELTVSRTPENGGDVTYKKREEMERDFESGALHPGDLKAGASTLMVKILETLSDAIKKDGNANKGAKAMKAFHKKSAKKK